MQYWCKKNGTSNQHPNHPIKEALSTLCVFDAASEPQVKSVALKAERCSTHGEYFRGRNNLWYKKHMVKYTVYIN